MISRDWDAETYDRVSTPQQEWAKVVLDRLPLAGDEVVLDAGCGSGLVTRLLLDRLPEGRVIATDAAPSMVEQARANLPDERVAVLDPIDLQDLELDEQVDAVFSNAVFHWVPDHEKLFARLAAVLRPGGRLVVQCGGEGNVERFHQRAREVALEDPYAPYLGGWEGPWNFAPPAVTRTRLEAAGFTEVETWLEPWPVIPDEPLAFIETVCLGHHLPQLPEELRKPYAEAVLAKLGDPPELDYVRLNITATGD